MEIAAARRQVVEVLPTFAVQRDDFSVQDRLLHGQLFAHPIAELLKSLQDVPAFGPEAAAVPRDVKKAAIAVILGLEQPAGIVERLPPRCQEDRLDQGRVLLTRGLTGLLGSLTLPVALPTRRTDG